MAELTTVYLCQVDLDSRYEHSIHFATRAEQSTFFYNHRIAGLSSSNYTHIRRSWDLQLSRPYTDVQNANYLYFNQGGKTWYYFINSYEYKNEGSTTLNLELDVIQTYMFDWNLAPCFIERQHTTSDNKFEHNLDEGLECGELVVNIEEQFYDMSELAVLVFSTLDPDKVLSGTYVYNMRSTWDNVYSAVGIYAVEEKHFARLSDMLENLSGAGKIDCIVSMHMYPKNLIRLETTTYWGADKVFKPVLGSQNIDLDNLDVPQPKWTNKPKNNKVYNYPFNVYVASNNNGQSAVYKPERFLNGDIAFRIYGGVMPDSGCKLVPKAYNTTGSAYNDEEGITINGFPSCAWEADTYKIWLAQNQNQHALTISDANVKKAMAIGDGAMGAIGSLLTGDLMGVADSAIGATKNHYAASMQIKSLVAQKNDMSITPPQSRGSFSPSLNIAHGFQQFSLIHKTINEENMKIVDDYFTMYGYKLNRIGVPNLNARLNHTYIKTVGCIVKGNFNNNDKLKISSIFDKGITFWKDGDNIGDYSKDNFCY